MKEIQGNIWDYHDKGYWIVITTNGTVRKDGACVMGRGVAKQAKDRFPLLPYEIGRHILSSVDGGNIPHYIYQVRIATFPVKHNWWERADLELIEYSAERISPIHLIMDIPSKEEIYMVRPGCGNGQLDWKDVKPILEKYLDDRFVVVEKEVKGGIRCMQKDVQYVMAVD